MMTSKLLRVLGVIVVLAIACSAHAVMLDPRAKTSTAPPAGQPTPRQLDEQMKGPKVLPPVEGETPPTYTNSQSLPSGDPQAVLEVTNGPGHAQPLDKKPNAKNGGPNGVLGLAITCGILGLVAFGGALAVRKGPRTPSRSFHDDVSRDSTDDDVKYEI